jgi:hypothetical protein
MSYALHPNGLPDLFLDRSLGRHKVPLALRAAGLRLTTLAERYGVPADERVTDVDWLSEAGRHGEVVFMKDERIRYNLAERTVVREHAVRCFCLSRKDLDANAMAALYIDRLPGIVRACSSEGPFIFVVNRGGLRRLPLE